MKREGNGERGEEKGAREAQLERYDGRGRAARKKERQSLGWSRGRWKVERKGPNDGIIGDSS
jgi:hypothetical protein